MARLKHFSESEFCWDLANQSWSRGVKCGEIVDETIDRIGRNQLCFGTMKPPIPCQIVGVLDAPCDCLTFIIA